jgi:CHASE2 domain-containing sensor protein/signal transduction histidine kinase
MFIWPQRGFRRAGDRHFLKEWLRIAFVGLTAVIALASFGWTDGADRLLYDRILQQSTHPLQGDIVIVAIDDQSLSQLGRWPWPRSLHAKLLEQLAQAQPAGVIYDVLFTEPSPDDHLVAAAMAGTRVYLPLLLNSSALNGVAPFAVLPVASLAAAAAGVGHTSIESDSDGIVRGVALQEGNPGKLWPQLTVPPYLGVAGANASLPGNSRPNSDSPPDGGRQRLIRNHRILIPFSSTSRDYPVVSFASVLHGEVPASFFHRKLVLVGATASGLRDRFATPVSGREGVMSGVEIHANILDALLSHHVISPSSRSLSAVASVLPVMMMLIGLLSMTPRWSLIWAISLCAASLAVSVALLNWGATWVTPVPALITIVLVYPLWSWRRLEFAMSYLGQELGRLTAEPHLLPERRRAATAKRGDALEQYIAQMQQAAQRLRDLRRFIWDSLNSLPDPILVTDRSGRVQLVNQPARDYFARSGQAALETQKLDELLGGLSFVRVIGPVHDELSQLPQSLHWPELLDPSRPEHLAVLERGIEVRDSQGHDQMLKYARCMNANGDLIGWIASLTDLSALHSAQRQRDDMLHLLSHDMRSPQSSIITLLDIERPQVDSPRTMRMFDRIERYSRRALALADNFVQLAHAEMQTYTMDLSNLADLAQDAADEIWPQANAKQIEIRCQIDESLEYTVRAERSLITRALVNVMNNAVKYSPPNTRIDCILTRTEAPRPTVQCLIRDQGYGIPLDQQAHLFERFKRFRTPDQPQTDGVGLGMAFVKTVVARHGGTIRVESETGRGTSLTIALPAAQDVEVDGATADEAVVANTDASDLGHATAAASEAVRAIETVGR